MSSPHHVRGYHVQRHVGLGNELRIDRPQLEHEVQKIRLPLTPTISFLVCEDLLRQLKGALARSPEARQLHHVRKYRRTQKQPAQQRGQILRVTAGRQTRHHVAHLLRDEVLERRQRFERLADRPLRDLGAGNIDDLRTAVLRDACRVSLGLNLPHGDVVDAVHRQDRTRCAHLVVKVRHGLERPEYRSTMSRKEVGRVRADHAYESASRSMNPEDRSEFPVLADKEGHQTLAHGEAVAQDREARGDRDLFRSRGLGGQFARRLELLDRPAHCSGDKIEISQQLDAVTDLRPFLRRQDRAKHAARIGKCDDPYVSGIGNIVAEQEPHDPQSGLFDPLAVRDGIAP